MTVDASKVTRKRPSRFTRGLQGSYNDGLQPETLADGNDKTYNTCTLE